MDKLILDAIGKTNDPKWILEQVVKDLKGKPDNVSDTDFILPRLAENLYGFNHPSFAVLKNRQREQDDYISTPYEVEEGVIQCGKCSSFRVFSSSVQTRAADEPMTTVAYCVKCKNRWTQNG
jgi:DNA-directed RNA polymerase subunit M/transcription elongation factor TFIIS